MVRSIAFGVMRQKDSASGDWGCDADATNREDRDTLKSARTDSGQVRQEIVASVPKNRYHERSLSNTDPWSLSDVESQNVFDLLRYPAADFFLPSHWSAGSG